MSRDAIDTGRGGFSMAAAAARSRAVSGAVVWRAFERSISASTPIPAGRDSDQDSAIRIAAVQRHRHGRLESGRAAMAWPGRIVIRAGGSTRVAFALRDGAHRERAGCNSVPGEFIAAEIAS